MNETIISRPPRLLPVVDGHVLIAYTPKGSTDPTWGVGLFAAPAGEWHTFVVWDVIAKADGWIVERGDYARTLPDALEFYALRDGEL